jgi:hypothetical protein
MQKTAKGREPNFERYPKAVIAARAHGQEPSYGLNL